MRKNLLNTVSIGLIVVALLISGFLAWQRVKLESANRQLELTLEYSEIEHLARWSGVEVSQLLKEFKSLGVTGILFKEETLAELESREVWVKTGNDLALGRDLPESLHEEIVPEYTYLLTWDQSIFNRLAEHLEIKDSNLQLLESEDGPYLIGTPLNQGEMKVFGLGFNGKGIELSQKAGLNILLQLRSWPQADPEGVRQILAGLQEYDGVTAMLFNDGILPGFPEALPVIAEETKKMDAPVGIIEFFPQQGLNQLAQMLGKNAVRLHAISDKEMVQNMTPQKAVDRFVLAAAERNNQILLVRFFFKPEASNWLSANLDYVSKLSSFLKAEGFAFGPAQPFGSLPTSRVQLFFMGLGVIAGGILLLQRLQLAAGGAVLGLLGALGWTGLLALGQVNSGRLLMALAAVIIFPTLAITANLDDQGAGLGKAVHLLVKTSLFSLIGAVLMVGLLADVGFMLKIDQFRGVKAAHVLPLLFILVIFFFLRERSQWLQRIVEFLQTKISIGWAALAGVLAVALLLYVSRTGNESAAVSSLELQLRTFLDKILVVRPRTKEFLVGHPLLLLNFYLGYRHKYLPLLMLGAIGQVSLVNTFAHIHTPLLVSLFRAFNGLWLGIILGVGLIVVYRLAAALGKQVLHGK